MKRTFALALLGSMCLYGLAATPQSVRIVKPGDAGTTTGQSASATSIDKVNYRVTYATNFVTDTTKRDSLGHYVYRHDEMRLDIGQSVSKFYSERGAIYEKWLKEKVKRGETDFTNAPAGPSMTWVVYRNYPKGETSFLSSAMMNNYRISEKTVTPEWTIDADTCTLLKYHCTKAETRFKGRHWTVWFTEDIPLDYGPWKLAGLPGLILKAEDSQRQYCFEAKGLEQVDGKEDITLVKNYKKYEPVSQKEYDKVNRTTTVNDAIAAAGISISFDSVKNTDEADDFMKKMKAVPPYNPIEIAE